jgi:anaerobic selenocysteine-containing dehydrogenase
MVTAERLWNRMGASGLERSICGAAAETAVAMTMGARRAPDPSHVLDSRMIIIWGHNPATTNPHFVPFLRQAQRDGAYVVVIDPRRTRTARSADLHVQPNPATDGALALAMMHVIFTEDLHDEAWLEANTIGWRALRERVQEYPPDMVAEISGIPAETIRELARRFATAKPAILKFADGIQRHGNGGQTARALACLAAVAGQVGRRGGGLYYSTSGYVNWDAQAVGHAAECPPTPRIVNMNRLGAALTGEVDDPPIKALYVFNANPAASTPNAGRIVEGLQRDDLFTVVHELFMTDTAQYADIVLPATSQLEQVDAHRPYGHRHLQYNTQAIEPLGEAKSNWDVMQLLATAMGYDELWLHQTPGAVIDEIIEASRPANPLLNGITGERLRQEGTVRYAFDSSSEVPFADGRFLTPSGKLELYCDAFAAQGFDPLPHYEPPGEFVDRAPDELVLISGAAHHFVSSSLANVPKLKNLEGGHTIELNPADAARHGIVSGMGVIAENERGWCQLRAIVTDDVPPGVAVAPKGHWSMHTPGGRNVNWTTSDAIADLAGQSTFHSNLVRVRPAAAAVAD